MGRLPALNPRSRDACVVALACLSFGCQDDTKAAARSAPRERSEVVVAQGTPPETKAPGPSPIPVAAGTGPAVMRKICEGQLAKSGRDLTKKSLARKFAPGAKAPSPTLTSGKWLWINLWAAWCAPCKEEMPRLSSFASRLAQNGHEVTLAFVSLDDDERQLEQFLAGASEGLPRATYWLRDGRERDDWLTAMGLPKAPDLPVQLLVDPRGKVRCTVNGAIEESDYNEVASVLTTP
jgi:thiol-disulfide isomerase/thioredoxin